MTKTKTPEAEPVTVQEQPQPAQERSYFEARIIDELGVTDELNQIRLKFEDLESNTSREVNYKIFDEDEAGNIIITPFTLRRELIQYDSQKATPTVRNIENSRRKVFYVTRLKVPEVFTDKKGNEQTAKYKFPKGAETQPFITPGLCDKFEKKQKIKTLVLTEGYFKAFRGYMAGLDIVGLSSISHYKQKDTETMYTDILELIKVCQVENVIMLYDGDARNISTKDLAAKRELRRRPMGFINSARNVRELLKDCGVDIYFAAVSSDEIAGNPKGLDDLYNTLPDESQMITKDLVTFSSPCKYFWRLNIRFDMGPLYKWFSLDSAENFRELHSKAIGNREFIYNGTTYKYIEDLGKLEIVTPGDAKLYFRVGDDYYKYVKRPNKYGNEDLVFMRRLKTTIQEDHGKKFIQFIPKYESFCNVPDHINYQRVYNNCFNTYAPFDHEPEEGDCSSIIEFMKHIFGPQLQLGLDYVQLLYQRPTQILPILCLVSKENGTGKSTFIKLMKAIFTQNCTNIGNDDLGNQFNFWVTKLLVTCEESFIEKKVIIEKIKALSTADTTNMNKKGKDQDEIEVFLKFIFASNNEDNFIYASKDDIRYWVVKVPVFSGPEKTNLMQEMVDEIPAFLDFLNKREMSTTNQSRMWFRPEQIRTEALDKLVQNSRPGIEKELYEALKTLFFEFGESEIMMTPTNANDLFIKRKQDVSYLSRIFRENMKAKPFTNPEGREVVKSYSIPYWGPDVENPEKIGRREYKFKGRPFVFRAAEILDKSDLKIWEELQNRKEEPEPATQEAKPQGELFANVPDAEKEDLPF